MSDEILTPTQQRMRDRKAAGLCYYCKNPALPGKLRCQIHTEITADYSAGRRDIWLLKGLCGSCGKEPREGNYTEGANCRARRKKAASKLPEVNK